MSASLDDPDLPRHSGSPHTPQGDSPRRQAVAILEASVENLLSQQDLADVWSTQSQITPGEIIAVAAQACVNVCTTQTAGKAQIHESVFSELLKSSRGWFCCAEVNLGDTACCRPLLVLAVSDTYLTWNAYARQYRTSCDSQLAATEGHFNLAVQEAAAKLPLQQLAWLLSDQQCRLIVCGAGTAGAIAQHAAVVLQQLLQSSVSDEGNCVVSDRVLCVTFGAPPSSLSPPVGSDSQMSHLSAIPGKSALFWNFLLANAGAASLADIKTKIHRRILPKKTLADVLPAVMSTIPTTPDSAMQWLEAVTDVQAARSQDDLCTAVDDLLAAGEPQEPQYMGHTWLLVHTGASESATGLAKRLKISNFEFDGWSRLPLQEYSQAAEILGHDVFTHPSQRPTNLLAPLKLQGTVKGFFKPLTASVAAREAVDRLSMVGFQITVQGTGVQWVTDKVMKVEMVGGEYGLVNLKVLCAKPTRRLVQAESRAFSSAGAGLQANAEQLIVNAAEYSLTVTGQVIERARSMLPVPPDPMAPVDIFLYLETHFGEQRILLQKEPCEQDAKALKTRLASGAVEHQLQRAIMSAVSCLACDSEETMQKGQNVLNAIDRLEGWCRAKPKNLDKSYFDMLSKTAAQTPWYPATIKATVMRCFHEMSQDSADLGGGATIFNRLDKYSAGLNSNTKSIAAVLASPLLMEYEVEYARIAGMYGLFFVGVAALCIIAPPLGVGLMAGEIVLASAAGAATLVTGQYIGSKVLTVGAGVLAWLQQLYRNHTAYLRKLTELVGLLAPEQKPQQDVSTLEGLLFKVCSNEMADASPLGLLLMGPDVAEAEAVADTFCPKLWDKSVLAAQRHMLHLPDQQRPTVSCKQALVLHLQQICAMAHLRQQVQHSCLVGCVGDVNAGKTTLIRCLLGLPPEVGAHRTENATRCVAATPMPLQTSEGLKALAASPLLVDTPGMFDSDSLLADCAVRYLGSMAMYIIVLPAMKSGRLDAAMQDRIVDIACAGKPTLICCNQMSRYMDWWSDATEADAACEAIRKGIADRAPTCRSLSVYLTEFTDYDKHYEDMQRRNIKSVEHVREWVCHGAYICGFDLSGTGGANV